MSSVWSFCNGGRCTLMELEVDSRYLASNCLNWLYNFKSLAGFCAQVFLLSAQLIDGLVLHET